MTGRRGLTLPEAAARLGVSSRTMQRYLKAYLGGDTSRGFVASRVSTQRGHGYEWRFTFGPDATPDAPSQPDTPGTVVPVRKATPDTTPTPTPEGVELATLALRALDEAMRENQRLRAMLESRHRPWWERWRRRP